MAKNKEISEREYAAELVRLVDNFKEKLQMGTSSADDFLTISEIEQLWSELRGNTSELYSDMVQELLSTADESDLTLDDAECRTTHSLTVAHEP